MRPKKFKSPETMQKSIDKYFKDCDDHTKTKLVGGKLVDIPAPLPYTVEGLCMTLGVDRKTLLNYEKDNPDSDFFHTIKSAKMKIQRKKVEGMLMGDYSTAGAIFDMKNNHGYVDRVEQETTHKGGGFAFKINGQEFTISD